MDWKPQVGEFVTFSWGRRKAVACVMRLHSRGKYAMTVGVMPRRGETAICIMKLFTVLQVSKYEGRP
jgi:hypothetical protein